MKKLLILFLILGFFGACSNRRQVIKTEFEFANKLARQGLWKEAHYRWNKLLANDKDNVALYNNIAISLEKMGKFDEAEKMYKKALALRKNPTVQVNYDKLKRYLKFEDSDEEEKDDKKKRKKNK